MKTQIIMLGAVLLAGCASPSSSKFKASVSSPDAAKSIVLLRLSSSLDGRPGDSLKGKARLIFQLANMDEDKTMHRLELQPVRSAEFATNGWVYSLLNPGTYQLHIYKTRFFQRPGTETRYRLYIPSGRPLLYAGTFKATSQLEARWSLGARWVTTFRGELISEPAIAETVARAEFSDKGRLTAAIIHPADGFAAEKPMLKLGPISVETAGTSVLSEPHWKARAADDYLHAALVPGGDQSGVIAAYDLAAMPFAALAGAVDGQISKKKWAPCVRGLSEELSNCDLPCQLHLILTEQLQNQCMPQSSVSPPGVLEPPGTGLKEDRRYLLRGDVRRVELVQGRKRNTVCTRVAVRFRLLDKQADDYLYDRTLIASSGFMEIKELSGEPGRALFVQELTSNIHALVEQFFQEANPSQNSDNPQLATTP